MFKVIALAVAIAAITSVAGAQAASTAAKSTVKTGKIARQHKAKAAKTETEESPAALQKEAKISEATARATALKEVPTGTVKKYELERENGKLIYSYDISVPGKTGIEEVAVNAIDGSVVAHEHETPKAERAEAAKEAKEKKAKK